MRRVEQEFQFGRQIHHCELEMYGEGGIGERKKKAGAYAIIRV